MLKFLFLLTLIGVGSCVSWNFWGDSNEEDDESAQTWPPEFCNDMDCPQYTLITKTQDYELRSYTGDITWLSMSASGTEDQALSLKKTMAMKLMYYLLGNNEDGRKMSMTVPVVAKMIPGNCATCKNNYTMSFYMPDGDETPEPSDDALFLAHMPPTDFYVRSFSGFANLQDYMDEANALEEALKREGKSYKAGVYYMAGYDAPYKFWDRHNEIWFRAL